MEYDLLLKLIPPALALSLLAYLVNFFGKVIADQQPFTDDRKWHVQIAGSVFMLNILFGSIIGIFFANTFSIGVGSWWGHLITLIAFSVVGTALLFNTIRESSRLYNYKKSQIEKLDKKFDGLFSGYATIGQFIPPALIPIIVSYFATIEYQSGNFYWIAASFIISFYIFFWSAFQYSLRKLEDSEPVTIHFVDKVREPIQNAKILKVNDDNIRARVDDTILILNKSEVFKIEMRIPEKLL